MSPIARAPQASQPATQYPRTEEEIAQLRAAIEPACLRKVAPYSRPTIMRGFSKSGLGAYLPCVQAIRSSIPGDLQRRCDALERGVPFWPGAVG